MDRKRPTNFPGAGEGGGGGRMPPQQYGGRPSRYQLGQSSEQYGLGSSPTSHGGFLSRRASQATHSSSAYRNPPRQSMIPIRRPSMGTAGTNFVVLANHFLIELNHKLYVYDVSVRIVPSSGAGRALWKEAPNWLKKEVVKKRVEEYEALNFKVEPYVYDGQKTLYTSQALHFKSEEVKLGGPWLVAGRQVWMVNVEIKFTTEFDLHDLGVTLRDGLLALEDLSDLHKIMRHWPVKLYGGIFSIVEDATMRMFNRAIGFQRCSHRRIYPSQMGFSLNVDTSFPLLVKSVQVTDFVNMVLMRNGPVRPLSAADYVKVEEALRSVEVEVTHQKHTRRYRIIRLTRQITKKLTFWDSKRGTNRNLVEYFNQTYGIVLQCTQLPCLQVESATTRGPTYMPMELCTIVKGQRGSKMLNETEMAAALQNSSCVSPLERKQYICEAVGEFKCVHADELRIEFSTELTEVQSRILPVPMLRCQGLNNEICFQPGQSGQWDLKNKRMFIGGTVKCWICINFDRSVKDSTVLIFSQKLAEHCRSLGLDFNNDPVLPVSRGMPNDVERVLRRTFQDVNIKLQQHNTELDLLIVSLPDNNGSLYGDVKRICETDLGVISQCCLAKRVISPSYNYLTSMALKINAKIGGCNVVLNDALEKRIPLVSDRPTIFFGADVTHPANSKDSSPSIAAVVASMDWPHATKYAALVSAQAPGQEIIKNLYKTWKDPFNGTTVHGGMVRELLQLFNETTRQTPEKIIFYRDGVSVAQFSQVLQHEVEGIREAWKSLYEGSPSITFIVVQKRHNTRFFIKGQKPSERNKNVDPGTVVDSTICDPYLFDFYLCSHYGTLGTSRPAHYYVIWDENKFTADALQTLTYHLCYTYARCTSPVSLVPPVYYAHLAASRARMYLKRIDLRERGAIGDTATLHELKENVKRRMFYC